MIDYVNYNISNKDEEKVSRISIIETILLAVAISLDTFAIMTVEGAMLPKISKQEVLKVSTLFGSLKAMMLLLGNLLISYLVGSIGNVSQNSTMDFLMILSVFIFVSLGFYMLWKGLRDEQYHEKRHGRIDMGRMVALSLLTSIDAFLVGMGLSFVNFTVMNIFIPIIIINIAAVVLGVYTGYWYGIEQKSKAHTAGGGILLIIGFQLLFENLAVVI